MERTPRRHWTTLTSRVVGSECRRLKGREEKGTIVETGMTVGTTVETTVGTAFVVDRAPEIDRATTKDVAAVAREVEQQTETDDQEAGHGIGIDADHPLTEETTDATTVMIAITGTVTVIDEGHHLLVILIVGL